MYVYVEYAFIENFLLDGALLWIACVATRTKIRAFPLTCAAAFGAAFACVFALFSCGYLLSFVVKIAAGALLCCIVKGADRKVFAKGVSWRERILKWRAVAAFTGVFFAVSACLAGVMFAIDGSGAAVKTWQIPVCISFVLAAKTAINKLFRLRRVARFLYRCRLYGGESDEGVDAVGFLDSGNRASVGNVPICFVSPEIAFRLIGEDTAFISTDVSTVGGRKKIKLFSGRVSIYEENGVHTIKEDETPIELRVYFSASAHLNESKGYSVLLPSASLEQ